MRSVKIILFLLLFPLLLVALPALAGHGPAGHLPRGPRELPPEAAPRAQKPFVERHVLVDRLHDGEDQSGAFGWIGTSLGDQNGDGRNEYLIAASYYDSYRGRTVVFDGDGSITKEHLGHPASLFGYSAAAAGDVDGDGTVDYIIGAPSHPFFGAPGQAIVYSGVDHTPLYELEGVTGFGTAVAGVGDADGDGYDDFAIGSELHGAGAGGALTGLGRIVVYSGRTGNPLWSRDGFHSGDLLGSGAGRVADLDGDGRDELVVAARGADAGNGRAYVLSGKDGTLLYELVPAEAGGAGTFGQFFASGAGDINADGAEDIFIGDYYAFDGEGRAYVYSGADGTVLHNFGPELAADRGVGPGRGIPDVDGDGHDDLLVAAYLSSAGAEEAGKVYVYSGADGSVLHEVTGNVPLDQLGVDALSLGDLDGDGRQEFLLTAPGLSFGGLDVGHNYVVSFATPPGVLPGN